MAREAGPFTTPRTARRLAVSSRGARGGLGLSGAQRRGQSSAVPSYRAPSASTAPVASTSRIPTIAKPAPRPNAYVAPVPEPRAARPAAAGGKAPATPPKSEPRRGRSSAMASTSRAQQGATPRSSSARFDLEAMSDDDERLEDATRPEGLDLEAEEAVEGDADEQELDEAEEAEAADRVDALRDEQSARPSTRSASRSSLAVAGTSRAPPARNAKSLSGLTSAQGFEANRRGSSSRATMALARTSTTRSNNSDSFATAAGEPTVSFADDTVGGEDDGQERRGGAKLRQSLVAPDGTIHAPTLDERCEVLITNSNAVLSFYTEIVEEGVAEDSAQDMVRSWDPFESYKTNQLLAEGQYHHHFIDAREVVRNHNVPAASISATFFDTMALVNRATFLHYVWQLPRQGDHALTIESGTWPPRAAVELLEARRVFLSWLVPSTLPLTDDILSLYIDLCTEAYVFRLREDAFEGRYDEQELRDRATGWKASVFGVEAVHTALARSRKSRGLSSEDIAAIETRFETFADVRMLECEELDDDWRFISEEWPLVRVASDLTRFVSQLDRPGPMPACSSSLPNLMAALDTSGAIEGESIPPSDSEHEDDLMSEASVPDTYDLAEAEDGMPSQSTPQARRSIAKGRESSARARQASELESVGDMAEEEDQGAESDATSLDNEQKMEIMIQMAVDEAYEAEQAASHDEDEDAAEEEADETVRGAATQRIRIDGQNRLVKVDASSNTPGRSRRRLLEGTGQGERLQEFDEGNADVFMEQQIKAKRAAQGAKYRSKRKGKGKEDEEEAEEDEDEEEPVVANRRGSGRASKKRGGGSTASRGATEVVVEVPATPRMTRRAAKSAADAIAEEEDGEEQQGAPEQGPDFDLAADDEMPDVDMEGAEEEEEPGQGRTAAARRSRRIAAQGGQDEGAEGAEGAEGEEQELSLPPPGQMQGLEPREAGEAAEGEVFEVEDDELTLQRAREATKQRRRAARSGLRDIGNAGPLTPTRKYQSNQRQSKRREQALKAVAQRRRSTRLSSGRKSLAQEDVDMALQDENADDAEEAEEVDQLELDPTQSGAAEPRRRSDAATGFKRTSRTRQPKPNKNAAIYISGGNMNGKRSWTQEETETLLDALYRVARRKRRDRTFMPYATILKLHGPRGTKDQKLARWNNVQLKDKARNECLRMRREGRTIPYWRALLFPTLWEPKKERSASQAPAGEGDAEEEEEDQLRSDSDSSSASSSGSDSGSSSGEEGDEEGEGEGDGKGEGEGGGGGETKAADGEVEAQAEAGSGDEDGDEAEAEKEEGSEGEDEADEQGEEEADDDDDEAERESSEAPSDASSLADREAVEAAANSQQ